jgi:hypothetical protein
MTLHKPRRKICGGDKPYSTLTTPFREMVNAAFGVEGRHLYSGITRETSFAYLFHRFGPFRPDWADESLYCYLFDYGPVHVIVHDSWFNVFVPYQWIAPAIKAEHKRMEEIYLNGDFPVTPFGLYSRPKLPAKMARGNWKRVEKAAATIYTPEQLAEIDVLGKTTGAHEKLRKILEPLDSLLRGQFEANCPPSYKDKIYGGPFRIDDLPEIKAVFEDIIRDLKRGVWLRGAPINFAGKESDKNPITEYARRYNDGPEDEVGE